MLIASLWHILNLYDVTILLLVIKTLHLSYFDIAVLLIRSAIVLTVTIDLLRNGGWGDRQDRRNSAEKSDANKSPIDGKLSVSRL